MLAVEEKMNVPHSQTADATRLLKAMANEHRLLVLCTLSDGEMSVGQINNVVPLSQSSLSQHLGNLRRAGLVDTRREAKTIFYRLSGNQTARVIEALQ
ncbi:MAG: DNA-binding transcriptional ArsR family regulator [Paraglaciecola psychrophila]|jgi:DNA-binding transcriptional ArsR family regulator